MPFKNSVVEISTLREAASCRLVAFRQVEDRILVEENRLSEPSE